MEQKNNPVPVTIGRIVWFVPASADSAERDWPAIVIRVWSPTCVNLRVFRDDGGQELVSSVPYDETGRNNYAWRWPERTERVGRTS